MFELKRYLLQQAPQSANDFAGALVVPVHVSENFPDLL
jgi:hypothetical protein